jgi:hypothetical protein
MVADNAGFHWTVPGGWYFMDKAGDNPHLRQSLHRTFVPGIQDECAEEEISN